MAKIGIFGGTFDPIHKGHLQLAQTAYKELLLQKVIFVPNHIQWMKAGEAAADAARMEMTRLAVEAYPFFEASDVELSLGGISYTYRTLEALKKQYTEDQLYFIMGADALFHFADWAEPERIMELATVAAAAREPFDEAALSQKCAELSERFGKKILVVTMPANEASSSEIRRLCRETADHAARKRLRQLLPEKVADYIEKNRLYHAGKEC